MNKVSVVILNFNGEKFISSCLDSVKKINKKDLDVEVIVVDNGSVDRSLEEVKKSYKDFVILENKINLGYADGNNVGVKYALENKADYVLVLNNDTIVDKDLVVELLKTAEQDPEIGIVGPKIYFAPGFEFHKDRYTKDEKGKVIWYAGGLVDWANVLASHKGVDEVDHGQHDTTEETDFVCGCAMMVKRGVFEKIGLFDSKYFLYFEDNDICQRAKRAGYKIVYEPKAYLYHLNAGASASGSNLQEYYITRNRLLYGLKYAPLRSKLALFRESLRLLLFGQLWKKRGVADFYLGRLGRGTFPLK